MIEIYPKLDAQSTGCALCLRGGNDDHAVSVVIN
jgi:hypothetical protein